MSTQSNVYSQGGGGTHYEFEVQTAYFISFILGCEIPGLANCRIIEFRQQAGSLGYMTDDLLLKCNGSDIEHKVLFQFKHNIVISEKSDLFKEVLEAAWTDFKNDALFNKEEDRIYLVKSTLTVAEKNHLKQLLNWAKLKASSEDFLIEVTRIKEKNNYYLLFKNIISHLDSTVTDDLLFTFLKCFDILEYDFGHESSSSKTNFLSLIQVSKAKDEDYAASIWNAVFTFISNSNSKGGYFTTNSIPYELSSFFSKTYYTDTQKKLTTLSQQNFEILDLIDDTIGNVNLKREEVFDECLEKFNKSKTLILTGDPGTGKSAIAKSLFSSLKQESNGYILVYKADQLNDVNLRDLFLPFGIQLTLGEIFAHFPLYTENVIYIDAVEKLLEGEGLAFKQLLKAIKNLPIKLVLSCRRANLNLITLKFLHEKEHEVLQAPILTDNEINYLATKIPVLKSVIQNKRLLSLIRIPKYLDYAFKAISKNKEGYDDLNEVEFINRLWAIIIENRFNENYGGLPAKRSKLFIELAVLRAKRMQPFVKPPIADDIVIEKLEKDNVIVQSISTGMYAPAHDVIEDWALIRYVNEQFLDTEDDTHFFISLGTEPAMRRAYRLWVQTALKERDDAKLNFFTQNLKNTSLDRFWQDESLIAVLNSDYCGIFLEQNLSLLRANEWKLLFRIVHVMRTACRESTETLKNGKLLIPTGFGWVPTIKIIQQNIDDIPIQYYNLILNTVEEWSNKIFFSSDIPQGIREAGLIIIHLLNTHFLTANRYQFKDRDVERCLSLIFNLSGGITQEVSEILNNAIAAEEQEKTDENWIDKRYQSKILELALSGPKSMQLARFLPDLLITAAKIKWYRRPKKSSEDSPFSFVSDHHSLDINYHFGLVDKFKLEYFPASAYQTPVFWMLQFHPHKALDFIIELVNNTTEKYIASDFAKKDECIQVELTLHDGTKIKQHGSYVLWMMYRGTGKVTPYLLQSVLMALEAYLLDVGKWGDNYKNQFQTLLEYLYVNSNSVAITSVIASACMAYPEIGGNQLLPLFTDSNLLSWDVSRYINDRTPFHLKSDNPAFDKERVDSDKLQHRTKYLGGLQSFIVDYCFNIGILNQELFAILDNHRKNASTDDISWRKKLDEMDIRTWRPTKKYVEGDKISVLIEPTYSEDVSAQVEEWKIEQEVANKSAGYQLLLVKVQKKEESVSIEKWLEIYDYYNKLEAFRAVDHSPGTLAMIGIRDLWSELNDEKKGWSVDFILEIIQYSIDKQYRPYGISLDYSLYDMDSAMKIFPLVITLSEVQHEKESIQKLFIEMLITHYQINDPDYKLFLKSVDDLIWKNAPEDALKIFKGTIAFSKFTEENPYYIDHNYSEEQATSYFDKYTSFINDIYEDKFPTAINHFNYQDYSKWVLYKTVLIVPTINPPEECITFLKKLINFWIQNEASKERTTEYDQLDHHIRYAIQDKLSAIIFWNATTVGGELLEYLISKFYQEDVLSKVFKENDIWSFFKETIRNLIVIADHNLPENNDEKSALTISNFKKTWIDFDLSLSKMPAHIFSDLLLLNINWKDSSVEWKPIEDMSDFFENAIKKYGASNIPSIFNLLSHIGDKTLLPQGLKWLVDILRKASDAQPVLNYKYSEQLMHRIYDNHISKLKADKALLENYLWMLNEMITQGSSDAYWIREFLISFR